MSLTAGMQFTAEECKTCWLTGRMGKSRFNSLPVVSHLPDVVREANVQYIIRLLTIVSDFVVGLLGQSGHVRWTADGRDVYQGQYSPIVTKE